MSFLLANIGPGKTGPFGAAARSDEFGWLASPMGFVSVCVVVGGLLAAIVVLLVRRKMGKG